MSGVISKTHAPARGALTALVLLTGLNLFNYIDRYVLPPVQPLIQKEFGISDAQAGLLYSAFFFVYMLAAPLTGWLGDRYRRKPLLIFGALLWSAMTLLTATVHSYHQLLFRHAAVGIGEATFVVFAPSLLADFYDERERNRVLSVFNIAIPLGAALGYLIGGALGASHGWRAPFYVAAIPGALISVLLIFTLHEPKRGAAELVEDSPERGTWRVFISNKGFIFGTLGMAWMTFSIGGIANWMPTFLVKHAGYSLSSAGFSLGAVTAVDGIAGTWVGGWLAQRMLRKDHRALYRISGWSMLLAIPGALMAFFGPARLVMPSIALAEFFLFLNTGPLNAAIVNSVSARIRSTALAFEILIIHLLGDVPSPWLIGVVSDHSSLRVGLALTMVAMAASGAVLFAGMKYAPQLKQPPSLAAVAET